MMSVVAGMGCGVARRTRPLVSAPRETAQGVRFEGADPGLEREWHFPEVGVKRENAVMVLRCDAVLPVGLGYTLRRVGS
jgi:hypothetical protein